MSWIQGLFYSSGYLNIIKVAFLTFPFLAFLITLPYMIHQYHKYGAVYYLRAGIFYSLILYLLVAYFLVILPLPTIESVKLLTSPQTQLIPFHFIIDIINESPLVLSKISTYLPSLFNPSIYVVLYNILLTVPFGVYLRYYFKCSMKKTLMITFFLSLFFELTQLSGLYFIYPRGYRLFDVDDLILNTFGGGVGYFVGRLVMYFLPNRDQIETDSYRLGLKISVLRRIMTYGFDLVGFVTFSLLTYSILPWWELKFLFYFILIPYALKGKTFGELFFHIKMVTYNDESLGFFKLCARQLLAFVIYFLIPFTMLFIIENMKVSSDLLFTICFFSALMTVFLLYIISFVRLLRRKPLFHEILTGTKWVSTIKVPEKKSEEMKDI